MYRSMTRMMLYGMVVMMYRIMMYRTVMHGGAMMVLRHRKTGHTNEYQCSQ